MKTVRQELKLIFKTKNQTQAVNELFKRLEKRSWSFNGKPYHLSGIMHDKILFTSYEKEGEGVLIERRRFCPLDTLDCLSGKLETINA